MSILPVVIQLYMYIHTNTYLYIYIYICIYNILYISIIFYNTGFCQKNSHPLETTEIPCLPPQRPTSMLWSEVASIINRNGCFFGRPPNTKFRRQHWIGDGGDMSSMVWYFMGWLFFLKNPVCIPWHGSPETRSGRLEDEFPVDLWWRPPGHLGLPCGHQTWRSEIRGCPQYREHM